jgi:hypothetical protein
MTLQAQWADVSGWAPADELSGLLGILADVLNPPRLPDAFEDSAERPPRLSPEQRMDAALCLHWLPQYRLAAAGEPAADGHPCSISPPACYRPSPSARWNNCIVAEPRGVVLPVPVPDLVEREVYGAAQQHGGQLRVVHVIAARGDTGVDQLVKAGGHVGTRLVLRAGACGRPEPPGWWYVVQRKLGRVVVDCPDCGERRGVVQSASAGPAYSDEAIQAERAAADRDRLAGELVVAQEKLRREEEATRRRIEEMEKQLKPDS